jgi:hypothetical protein
MLTQISVGPMLKLKLCQTLPKTEFSSLPARSSLSGSLAPGYHKDILAPMPKTPSNPMPPASDSPKTTKIKLLPLEKYPTAQNHRPLSALEFFPQNNPSPPVRLLPVISPFTDSSPPSLIL